MQIGELAKRTSCSVRVIRHYEQCGLLLSTRGDNGYRQFDQDAVDHVMRIRVLLRNGFNVDEIRPVVLMHDPRPRKLVCADVIRLYESKLKEIEHRIAELTELHDRAKQRLNTLLEQRKHGGPEE